MDMVRFRKPINVTLDPELVAEMDALLERLPYRPKRTNFIETAIRKEIDAGLAKERRPKQKPLKT